MATEETLLLITTDKTNDEEICIMDMPDELLVMIMSFLNIETFQSFLRTCSFFSRFGCDEHIWKELAQKEATKIFPYKPPQVNYKWMCLAKVGSYSISRKSWSIYGGFTGDENNPKENGIAIANRDYKIISGQFKDGELSGYGICWWKNRNRYDGDWVEGKQHGNGKFIWSDGDYYEGEWKNDRRHGKGKYVWPKGSYYEGDFVENELDGEGTYTWKNGYYKGTWNKSCRHGEGEIAWTNGNRFVGTFQNNMKEGYGEYHWSDGASYKGEWNNDLRDGEAVTSWANGVIYQGQYKEDLRDGKGTLIWPNGDKYVGNWEKGGRYGPGVFYSVDGLPEKQWWTEAKKIQYSKSVPSKQAE